MSKLEPEVLPALRPFPQQTPTIVEQCSPIYPDLSALRPQTETPSQSAPPPLLGEVIKHAVTLLVS